MRLNRLALGVLALGFLPTAGCKKELKEFSPDGKFKVMMRGTPKEQSQTAMGLTVKAWGVDQSDGAFAVSATDLPTTLNVDPDTLLEGAMKGAASSSGSTLTNQATITLNGKYPGREFKGTIPSKDAFLHARIYLVNGRLYQVLVLGKKGFMDSPDTTTFMDSFQLVE